MKIKSILAIGILSAILSIVFTGCATTSMMDKKVSSKKARIIFNVSSEIDIEKVKTGLYDAVSLRVSDLNENENLLPEELPQKPLSPKQSKMFSQLAAMGAGNPSFEMMQLDMSNAYYSVSGQASMASGFNTKAEYYKAAVYPYQDGYKVYLYLFYQEGTDGIMGALTKKIADSIVGKEGSLLYMAQVRDEFIKSLPKATIMSQSPRKLEKVVLNDIGLAKN